MPEAEKEAEPTTDQITFRLLTPLVRQLDAMADADKGMRRPSRHDVARKIVTDFLARKR